MRNTGKAGGRGHEAGYEECGTLDLEILNQYAVQFQPPSVLHILLCSLKFLFSNNTFICLCIFKYINRYVYASNYFFLDTEKFSPFFPPQRETQSLNRYYYLY